jgi:hypothetical protein|tara:strand:+ start:1045 stop:1614 length:570 start_codon:yes stop_codon:yes gene_type:complete
MKKSLVILVLTSLLSGCSSLEVVNINFDAINKVKKEDYIIVAFESFQLSSNKHYKAKVDNYFQIENTITEYCKNKGKNTFGTSNYKDKVAYTYGNDIEAVGQRFWCAKNLQEAQKLYQKYLKKPDEYLSFNQEEFLKQSIKWLNNGDTSKIANKIAGLLYSSKLKPYGPQYTNPISVKSKNTKTNLVRE